LDASQRAAAAVALLPLLEAEAKERQGTRTDIKAILPGSSFGQARTQAASLTGASDGYVRDAKRIVEKDASMLERIRDGEITVQEAKRQLGFKQTLAAINSDEDRLIAAIADIEEIPELLDIANDELASQAERPVSRAKEPQESQTKLLRRIFAGTNAKLMPSTLNSGVVSSIGRYDLALYGLTAAQVKAIRGVV
jgi:hypothetical protein